MQERRFKYPKESKKVTGVRVMTCALLAVFVFSYLYFFQSEAIALAQHELSGGQTSFHPLIGSVVLTCLFFLIQNLLFRILPLPEKIYPLTFIPSTVLLLLTTAFTPDVSHVSLFMCGGALLLWLVLSLSFLLRKASGSDTAASRKGGFLSATLCCLALLLLVGVAGRNDDVSHYEMRAAALLNEGRYEKALEVGEKSLATSRLLTALRAYAMSHAEEGLPEHLFEMPLPTGGSEALFLLPSDTARALFYADSLYRFLGARPRPGERSSAYFKRVAENYRRFAYRAPARDYWLCSLLLDKQLDRFAEELPKYYAVNDSSSLPKSYAEALLLYNRLRTQPVVVYRNEAFSANLRDFVEMESQYPSSRQRSNYLRRSYGDTYYWYYLYHPMRSEQEGESEE